MTTIAPSIFQLLRIGPGDLLRFSPTDEAPYLLRFIATEPDGRITYEQLSITGEEAGRTVPFEEFLALLEGAVGEPLHRIMSDQEWAALAAYLRFAVDHDLGPKDLMDFYRFFMALEPAPSEGERAERNGDGRADVR